MSTGQVEGGLTNPRISPNIDELLDGALDADIATAGLRVVDHRIAAGGRTQILVLARRPAMSSDDRAAIITELGRRPLAGPDDHEVRLLTVEHPPGVR